MNEGRAAIVRRGLLDLINDIGGENSDDTLTQLLRVRGHRLSGDDVIEQMRWLGEHGFLVVETLSLFTVASITRRGIDVAIGQSVVEGVYQHKVGR